MLWPRGLGGVGAGRRRMCCGMWRRVRLPRPARSPGPWRGWSGRRRPSTRVLLYGRVQYGKNGKGDVIGVTALLLSGEGGAQEVLLRTRDGWAVCIHGNGRELCILPGRKDATLMDIAGACKRMYMPLFPRYSTKKHAKQQGCGRAAHATQAISTTSRKRTSRGSSSPRPARHSSLGTSPSAGGRGWAECMRQAPDCCIHQYSATPYVAIGLALPPLVVGAVEHADQVAFLEHQVPVVAPRVVVHRDIRVPARRLCTHARGHTPYHTPSPPLLGTPALLTALHMGHTPRLALDAVDDVVLRAVPVPWV
jgi:hypothetical protein